MPLGVGNNICPISKVYFLRISFIWPNNNKKKLMANGFTCINSFNSYMNNHKKWFLKLFSFYGWET